ncbi:threonine synthase [Staphylococcus kloosii]|jgi:threonine synthase|uniref:threonine synthase n=1 Tax=Staphylococcus kloosii TaxID=29384 RepID=UPI00189EE9C2|nr:threonine synthase [Staphylococcus kloosii]MBF7024108.1 threonine synthase [Staphylococcus kloosii]
MESFICNECAKLYNITASRWRCECGGLLNLHKLNSENKKISTSIPSLWRYHQFIPVNKNEWQKITMGEGFTAMIPIDQIATTTRSFFKMDYMMPTLSFKDRGASVLISKAKELGVQQVIVDSSGNAGNSIAAYARRANIKCDVYVSETTSPNKIKQLQSYDANIVKIHGTREDVANAAQNAVIKTKNFYASHIFNPYFYEGTKTYAFETWEELGYVPDTMIVPVGNGTLLLGIYYGFKELYELNLTSKIPKLIAIQSANCAPLATAFNAGDSDFKKINTSETLAEGIAIAEPLRASQILNAIRNTNGSFYTVNENEIFDAHQKLSHRGLFVEHTTAANYAGFLKYKSANENESIVVPLCGSGLKSLK